MGASTSSGALDARRPQGALRGDGRAPRCPEPVRRSVPCSDGLPRRRKGKHITNAQGVAHVPGAPRRQYRTSSARAPKHVMWAIVENWITNVIGMVKGRVMSGALDDLEHSTASRIYPVYWQEFRKRADEYHAVVRFNAARSRNVSKGSIRLVNTGIGGVFFSAVVSVDKRKMEADFTLENERRSEELFATLKTYRDDIERSFGRKLCWEESPRSKRNKRRIFLRKSNVSLRKRDEWQSQHDWLIHHVVKLYLSIRITNTIF